MKGGKWEIGDAETFGRVKRHPSFEAGARHSNCSSYIGQHIDTIHSEKDNSTFAKDFYLGSLSHPGMWSPKREEPVLLASE